MSDRESVAALADEELVAVIGGRQRLRRAALLELIRRAAERPGLVAELGDLAASEPVREDRLFHLVSMAWVAIIGLLSLETPASRGFAEAAFGQLDASDQTAFLAYLGV